MSDGPQTCGRGLAANAGLPALLGELLGAQAEVLEQHMRAIDASDANASAELEAYTELARGFGRVAGELRALAEHMEGYRELAMPRHDVGVLNAPGGQIEAFRKFVGLERELLEMLRAKIAGEEQLLG